MPRKTTRKQPEPPERTESEIPGVRIAFARGLRGLTQKQLAEKTAKARTTLAQYESGAIEPSTEALKEIAAALDVSPAFLAFGELSGETTTHVGPVLRMDKDLLAAKVSQLSSLTGGTSTHVGPSITWDTSGATVREPWRPGTAMATLPRVLERCSFVSLEADAPAFGLSAAEDILIVDQSVGEARPDRRIYLLRSTIGVQPMRCEPMFGEPETLRFTGPEGQTYQLASSEITLEGVVLGTIKLFPAALGAEVS